MGKLAAGRTAEREAAFVALLARPPATLGSLAPDLGRLLESGDWPAQCYAARLLAQAGTAAGPVGTQIEKATVRALGERRQTAAIMLAETLESVGKGSSPALLRALGAELTSGDGSRQLVALKVAAALANGSRPLMGHVIGALKNPDGEIRGQAAVIVAMYGPAAQEAVPPLVDTLKHEDPVVVRRAMQALGAIGAGAASAVPALRESLGRREVDLPEEGIATLGAIGPGAAAAFEDLVALLVKDDTRESREKALSASAERAIPSFGPSVVQPLTVMVGQDRDRGPVAARILGRMGKEAAAAAPLLIRALKSSAAGGGNAKLLGNVAAALVKIDPGSTDKAVPAFARVLMGTDLVAAQYAADFLITYGRKTRDPDLKDLAISTLVKCLQVGSRGEKSREFSKLCAGICRRLPELGSEADVALPALKDCVYRRAPFAMDAKRAWKALRPNDKITDTPPMDGAGDKQQNLDDMIDDLM